MPLRREQAPSTSQVAPSPLVTRREWRRVIIASLLIVAWTAVPYVLGALASTPNATFGGLLIGLEDQYSYLAKMVQGAHGAWLFHLPYTAPPHPPIFLYTFYLVLGKLAALLGLPNTGMYHVARLIFGFITLLVIYRFIAEFVRPVALRWLAFLLTALAGGPGWLAFVAGQPTLLDSLPLEYIVPEGFTFLMLYTLPHLLLARTLLLLGAIGVWQAGATGSLKRTIGAGLLWCAMSIIQPIYAAIVLMLAFLMFLSRSIVLRRPAWRSARAGGIAFSMTLPMLGYVLLVFNSDPTYGPWSRTFITSPGPLLYALTYAIPLVLAVGGLFYLRRRREAGLIFLALWAIVTPFMLYAPMNAQRRLIESWQIPLSVLAAYGLVRYGLLPLRRRVAQRYTRRVQRVVIAALIVLLMPTYLVMFFWHVSTTLTHWPPLFQSAGFVATANWLEQNASYADGVLTAYDTGTMLPARADVRVMVGHPSETVYAETRNAEVERFFDATASDEWRRDLLRRLDLDYVWYGPDERALGAFDPGTAPYLKPVFEAGDIRLYKVEP